MLVRVRACVCSCVRARVCARYSPVPWISICYVYSCLKRFSVWRGLQSWKHKIKKFMQNFVLAVSATPEQTVGWGQGGGWGGGGGGGDPFLQNGGKQSTLYRVTYYVRGMPMPRKTCPAHNPAHLRKPKPQRRNALY